MRWFWSHHPKAHGKLPQDGSSTSESDASASSSSFCDEIDCIFCGMIFRDKETMKRALRSFSMKRGFEFRTEKSDSYRDFTWCFSQDGNFQLYHLTLWIQRMMPLEIGSCSVYSMSFSMLMIWFVSARASCIANALSSNYPSTHHGICNFHFQKNLETRFRNSNLISLIVEASRLYSKVEFDSVFS